MDKNYKQLDFKILNSKKSTIVSSQESLKEIVPINWSKEVLSGKKKVKVLIY